MIHIIDRRRPFTKKAGQCTMLPRTTYFVKSFLTRVEIGELGAKEMPLAIDIAFTGPASDLYLAQDLHLERVMVSAVGSNEKERYLIDIYAEDGVLWIENKRRDPINVTINDRIIVLKRKAPYKIQEIAHKAQPEILERLFLGKAKKLDWTMVARRNDLREIFPVLFHLGQITPEKLPISGIFCEDEESFRQVLGTRLYSMNVPTHEDRYHQGIVLPGIDAAHEPADWLAFIYRQIRALFVKEEGEKICILPSLFRAFDRGKMTQITFNGAHFSFEWSKRRLRKIHVHAAVDMEFPFLLPSPIKEFRLRLKGQDKGGRHSPETPPKLKGGLTYTIDRFRR